MRDGVAVVIGVMHARGQDRLLVRHFLVWHAGQKVGHAIQTGALLVHGFDHPPRRLGDVRALEHDLLGLGVGLPAAPRFEVHRRKFPLLERVVDAHEKAHVLLVVGDREPVFDQHDPRTHEQALEVGYGLEEVLVLFVGAEAHHPFDASAVVPAAVEQHDLAGGRQVRYVALEVPLRALALGWRGQRHGAADARVETLRHALDRAALARGVATLEDDDQLEPLRHNPVLQLDKLTLQTQQLLEIEPPRQGIVQLKMFALRQEVGELVVLELELDVLVEIILDLGVDALPELADRSLFIRARFVRAHGAASSDWRPRQNETSAMPDSSTIGATVLRQGRPDTGYLPALSVISLRDYMLGTLAALAALLEERSEWRATDDVLGLRRFRSLAGGGVPISRRPRDARVERTGRTRRHGERSRLSRRRRCLQGEAGSQISVHGPFDARQASRCLRSGNRRQQGFSAANLSVGATDYTTRTGARARARRRNRRMGRPHATIR